MSQDQIEAFQKNYLKYEQWFEKHRDVYQTELNAMREILPCQGIGLEVGVGSGLFSAGTGIDGQSFPTDATSDSPSISYRRWDSITLDANDFIEIAVDTTGRDEIQIGYKYRSSSSGPTTMELYYSVDGNSFSLFGSPLSLTREDPLSSSVTFYPLDFNLNSISAFAYSLSGLALSSQRLCLCCAGLLSSCRSWSCL